MGCKVQMFVFDSLMHPAPDCPWMRRPAPDHFEVNFIMVLTFLKYGS